MPLVRAARDDVGELGDRVPNLVLGVEEVRAEPDAALGSGRKSQMMPAFAELVVARRRGPGVETVTVPPRRSGSRGETTSSPASSQRSIRSCVSASERSRIRATPTSSITS